MAKNAQAGFGLDMGQASALEFVNAARAGRVSPRFEDLQRLPEETRGLTRLIQTLGLLHPSSLVRPGPFDLVGSFQRVVAVDPAPVAVPGGDAYTERKVHHFTGFPQSVVVYSFIKVLPANKTAWRFGEVYFKGCLQEPTDIFCMTPGSRERLGTTFSVGNVILTPGTMFDLFVRNYDRYSPAKFSVAWTGWLTR